jgi:hypothetical protein
MGESFKFQCPQCGRSFKSNKDLGGRLKRCGQCRGTFTIKRTAAVKKGAPAAAPEAVVLHDPELPIDQVFNALHEWQGSVSSLPGTFAREITFGHFDPAYRLTLEVTIDANGRRTKDSAHRETIALPPELGSDIRKASRKVVDLTFEHTSDLPKLLADKPPVVKSAAEQLAKELRPPAGGHFASRRLVVEHLQVWQTHWSFHQSEGSAWFFGRPLRVYLPDPPRRSAMPAVLATLVTLAALGAIGWTLWEFDLVRPGSMTSAPVAETKPVPPPSTPVKPASLKFAKDGLVLLDDGTFLRGPLERKDEAVIVGAKSVAPFQIETLHIDAPVFIRGELRNLDGLESRVATSIESKPARDAVVGLFLEVHRQKERWAQLEPLCAAGEIPATPAPQKRIESLRAAVEKLLNEFAPPPVTAPTTPVAGAKTPEVSPAVAMAAKLLARMTFTMDDSARAELVAGLQALKGEKVPESDLLAFVLLWLSRNDQDAGLVVDRVRVKTPQVDQAFDGTFEKQSEFFVKLKTFSGGELTAYREKDAWVARLPGGIQLDGAQVTATGRARTASSERLAASINRFPPARWLTSPAADHLKEAKLAAEGDKRKELQTDRGLVLLRALAAGHAGAALRLGTPAEILEARSTLLALGYAQSPDGRWERPEDRRALQMGQLIKSGKADEARALLPGGQGASEFLGSYRSAAVQLLAPIKTVEDLNRASAAIDQSLLQASTPGESKHVVALKNSVVGFGICPSCAGGPAKVCSVCRGKGTRTEACLSCNGLGYKITVGVGATGHATCEVCKGKPIRGTRPCERCEGKGTRSCAKCQGVTKLPAPTDLSRTRPCARCNGTGGHGDSVIHPCTTCTGLGLQLVPAGAPEATLP